MTTNDPLGTAILNSLQAQGIDVNRRQQIEFFFYFDDGTDAEEALDMLNHRGLWCIAPRQSDNGKWLVVAFDYLVPAKRVHRLNELQDDFARAEERYNGDFDGWGIAKKP